MIRFIADPVPRKRSWINEPNTTAAMGCTGRLRAQAPPTTGTHFSMCIPYLKSIKHKTCVSFYIRRQDKEQEKNENTCSFEPSVNTMRRSHSERSPQPKYQYLGSLFFIPKSGVHLLLGGKRGLDERFLALFKVVVDGVPVELVLLLLKATFLGSSSSFFVGNFLLQLSDFSLCRETQDGGLGLRIVGAFQLKPFAVDVDIQLSIYSKNSSRKPSKEEHVNKVAVGFGRENMNQVSVSSHDQGRAGFRPGVEGGGLAASSRTLMGHDGAVLCFGQQ